MTRRIIAHERLAAVPAGIPTSIVVVDDPYGGRGEKIKVVQAIRDDPLAAMRAARQVDQAQYTAGRHWQAAYELSEIGGARAIDPTKEAVDGGAGFRDPISDKVSRAYQDLARGARALGMEGEVIIRDVLGSGMTIVLAATKRGLFTEPERKYLGRRFRECLETLAVVYGYATKG